jgi:hypothetical protein
VFFFAAFFYPSGFFPNSLFTLKHFHIALVIAGAVCVVRGMPVRLILRRAVSGLLAVVPVLGIIAISFFSASVNQSPAKAFAVGLNLLLVLACFIWLMALAGERPAGIRYALYFFALGVLTQIGIGLLNLLTGRFWFTIHFLHNNHLGILSAAGFFVIFSCFLTERRMRYRWLAGMLSAGLFTGMVGSCSRTAWFSFLVCLFFYGLMLRRREIGRLKGAYSNWLFVSLGVLAVLVGLSCFLQPYVLWRVQGLYQVFDPHSWRMALADTDNFGFLGRLRREQFFVLGDIIRARPWTGIGFTQEVIGFHGFYLTLLGASGAAGLACFGFFIVKLCRAGFRRCFGAANSRVFVMMSRIMWALVLWLMCSVMETLFLHFWVWLIIFLAIASSGRRPRTASGGRGCGRSAGLGS